VKPSAEERQWEKRRRIEKQAVVRVMAGREVRNRLNEKAQGAYGCEKGG